MRKSKMFDFAMKMCPWPRGQGQMVQWDQMCIFPQSFQIIKPGVDISSNGRDIAIYVKMTLTSISRSLLWYVKLFLHSWKELLCHLRIYKPFINPLIIDWIMPLLNFLNILVLPTFWGHLRDDFCIFWKG